MKTEHALDWGKKTALEISADYEAMAVDRDRYKGVAVELQDRVNSLQSRLGIHSCLYIELELERDELKETCDRYRKALEKIKQFRFVDSNPDFKQYGTAGPILIAFDALTVGDNCGTLQGRTIP